jgi:dienelactone hydrolase
MTIRRWACALLTLFLTTGAGARAPAHDAASPGPQRVEFPSLDAPGGQAIVLPAWWFRAAPAGQPGWGLVPVVVMLHGCGGLLDRKGQLAARYREYTALLNAQGWDALAVDSLSPRGETELCTQREGTRRVTQIQRRRDALGALQWLAVQPGVDASRLALLGWSNGGSTVLSATNLNHSEVASSVVRPRFSVAFYPGCATEARRGYRPVSDTLVLVGLADDWTPAAPCQALVSDDLGAGVRVEAFDGAHHGFDGRAALTLRRDVPNGVNPGEGVHLGAHPEAREQSRRIMLQALQQAFAR